MKARSSLLILYYDLGIGGVQKKIVDITNVIGETHPGAVVHILLKSNRTPNLETSIYNKFARIICYRDVIPVRIPFFFPLFIFWHVWIFRPSSILAFSDLPSVCAVCTKILFHWRNIRVIINEDQDPIIQSKTHAFAWIRQQLVKFLYPFADMVGTVNSHFAELLKSSYHIQYTKIKYFHNWTRLDVSKPTRRKKFDLIYVGRLAPEKNLLMLFKTMKHLASLAPSISLAIVGEGDYETTLVTWIQHNNMNKNIVLLGSSMQVHNLLAQAKIFILPSTSEGVPMALLDAMAMKLPAIIARYPGVYDVVIEGVNAMTYETPKELQEKVLLLLRNRTVYQKMAEAAYVYVKKYHSEDNVHAYIRSLNLYT